MSELLFPIESFPKHVVVGRGLSGVAEVGACGVKPSRAQMLNTEQGHSSTTAYPIEVSLLETNFILENHKHQK